MSEAVRHGIDWKNDELDMIVADYFAMLFDELAGRPYVKARHNALLRERLGRGRTSIEFKHQNVSAVLELMGMPWIPGYKPARHYQGAIIEAIERYLEQKPEAMNAPTVPLQRNPEQKSVFVPTPALEGTAREIPATLRRLIRKFDPVERDRRDRTLGRAGEEFVVELERQQLADIGRADLSRKVRWVAAEEGDGAGYDILSFAPTGREKLLEVKTTNGSARTPFFVSRNELEVSEERQEDWRIYRVHLFATSPRIFSLAPPLDAILHLRPELWRASFEG